MFVTVCVDMGRMFRVNVRMHSVDSVCENARSLQERHACLRTTDEQGVGPSQRSDLPICSGLTLRFAHVGANPPPVYIYLNNFLIMALCSTRSEMFKGW
jgi:hypothetical protein